MKISSPPLCRQFAPTEVIIVFQYGVMVSGNGRTVLSPWLRSEYAAAYLGYCPAKLAEHRRSGTGPRFKVDGEVVVYHVQELDRFWQTQPESKVTHAGGRPTKES